MNSVQASFKNNKCSYIIENMPDGFAYHKIIADQSGKPIDYIFLEVNEAFSKLTGLKKEEILGKRVTGVLPGIKDDSYDWISNYGKVALTGEGLEIEQYSKALDKWYSVTVFSDENGYFGTVFHDITKTKKLVENLNILSEAAIRYLEFNCDNIDYQMIADDLLKLSGAEFTIVNIFDKKNKKTVTQAISGKRDKVTSAAKILGYSFIGKEWGFEDFITEGLITNRINKFSGIHELSNNNIPKKVALMIEKSLKLGDIYTIGINNKENPLGTFILFMPLRKKIENEESIEIFANRIRALLLRIKAEEELKESKERWEFALEGSETGVWDCNIQTKEAYYSKRWKEIIGYKDDEFKNTFEEWNKHVHPDDINRINEEINEHLKGKKPIYASEYRLLDKNGDYKWIFARGKVVKWTSDGKPLRIVGTHSDFTERKKVEEEIKYLSFHDKLTGLYNRRFFEEEIKRLDTDRQLPVSLIMGDANGLKMVNDAFGHALGDEFLKRVAMIFREACRKEDIIARVSGDEFAVILPNVGEKEVKKIADRINELCKKTIHEPVQMSISIGFATKAREDQDILRVFKKAEDRMYRNKLAESMNVKRSIISALRKTLEGRTNETAEHGERLRKLSLLLGETLKLNQNQLNELELLAILHDIGKIAIPYDILNKSSSLTKEEWDIIRSHCEKGFRIASASPELASVANAILSHHEYWDGNGYPRGLKGEEIPLISRIISILDAYDSMTNERPYRKAMTKEEAVEEIKRCSGKQFDPVIAKVFVDMV